MLALLAGCGGEGGASSQSGADAGTADGAAWHAWADRYVSADPARQIQLGLVQCDDPLRGHEAGKRWPTFDQYVHDTNCGIIDRIEANTGL